ncbi:integrase [Erwinia mallotivora]|uniref:Integrase n=1 Tax=Erwinia mallotivora TaxID=69222 RepID=A0A014NAE5_9GAMM|nr:tyrosine-type recombinase/integrase [Erwinia mallotivora]EXU76378.1 integrase [Erwinia mallotivora]
MQKLKNTEEVSPQGVWRMNKATNLSFALATHVLRHTFASWFMMNGGNIIALQQIMGHASIQQTMVYAHLAPDYLQHAVTLNPLGGGLAV